MIQITANKINNNDVKWNYKALCMFVEVVLAIIKYNGANEQ